MKEINFRCGTAEDFDQIRTIERDNMQSLVEQFRKEGWDEKACQAQIRYRLSQGKVWLIEEVGEVIGYYYFGPTSAEGCVSLDSIQVASQYQGQGYGSQLLKHFLEKVGGSGYQRAVLYVYPTNPAIYLYERFGFQKVKETEEHILMQRNV